LLVSVLLTYRIAENKSDSNSGMANGEKPKAMRLSDCRNPKLFDNNPSLRVD
jgi:hypothetical protein